MATKKHAKEPFSRYDTADYLKSEKDMLAYLETCMNDAGDDAAFIAQALCNARARGMAQLAKDTGLTREGLYKALGKNSNLLRHCTEGDEGARREINAARGMNNLNANNRESAVWYVKHMLLVGFVTLLLGCASAPTSESFYNQGVDAYRNKNYKEAIVQWSKAIDAGDITAKNNLAYLLFYGLGTKEQPQRAIELWSSAAAAGQSEAQWHLGTIYAEGTGVEKNLVTAYAWYRCSIASAEAHARESNDSTEKSIAEDARKSLVDMTDKMSGREIEHGQALATAYIKKYAPTQ